MKIWASTPYLDEAAIDLSQITTHLHGNDTQMILFVNPNEESLVVIMVDATPCGPVSASVGGLQESESK